MSKSDNTGLYLGIGAGLLTLFALKDKIISNLIMPTEFIIKYYKDAKLSEYQTGVPFLVTLAQAGLESNWGNNAPGFNFFGIKAGSSWIGEIQKLKTWECGSTGDPIKDGIHDEIITIYPPGNATGNASCNAKGFFSYRVYGKFRKYPSASASFIDHGKFLRDNSRYSKAFSTTTPEAFITEVHKGGYATDPEYSLKVINIINEIRSMIPGQPLV